MVVGNNFLWLTGFGCGILFMAIGIFAYIQEGGAFESYLFLIFVWLSMSLMYGWFGMITLYDEDGFTQGWLPLQKKRYTYEQLTRYKITLKGYKLYVGKKITNG